MLPLIQVLLERRYPATFGADRIQYVARNYVLAFCIHATDKPSCIQNTEAVSLVYLSGYLVLPDLLTRPEDRAVGTWGENPDVPHG